MKLTKNILAGIGIGVVAYLVAKKMGNKKTVKINVDPKSSADGELANGITYDNLGNEGLEDIYGLNEDNYYGEMEGDFYSADGDFVSEQGDFYDADGDFMNASGTCYHSADGVAMNDGEFSDLNFDEGDTMSFATGNTVVDMKTKQTPIRVAPRGAKAQAVKGTRPRPKKARPNPRKKFPKGKNVGVQRALEIWKRRLQALLKTKAIAMGRIRPIDRKIAQARQKVSMLQSRLNAPQNR
ncbi:MAG: hypothetical protein WCI04_00155 [archaeon]